MDHDEPVVGVVVAVGNNFVDTLAVEAVGVVVMGDINTDCLTVSVCYIDQEHGIWIG